MYLRSFLYVFSVNWMKWWRWFDIAEFRRVSICLLCYLDEMMKMVWYCRVQKSFYLFTLLPRRNDEDGLILQSLEEFLFVYSVTWTKWWRWFDIAELRRVSPFSSWIMNISVLFISLEKILVIKNKSPLIQRLQALLQKCKSMKTTTCIS